MHPQGKRTLLVFALALSLEETLLHLFFHCPFAVCCWNTLGLAPLIQYDLLDTLTAFRPLGLTFSDLFSWRLLSVCAGLFGLLEMIESSEACSIP
jgi:hypothetical protein